MNRVRTPFMLAGLLVIVTLAGCADESSPVQNDAGTEAPEVKATSTTGGIRGVVVDQAIVPIEGATVKVLNAEKEAVTDAAGTFVFNGLEPGSYFLQASHPFYDKAQATAVVEAGVSNPPAVKILLNRVITTDPFVVPYQFTGFITCSMNVIIGYAEECGEGLGIPRDSCFLINHPPQCVSNPVMPGERVAKNPNNRAGQEWYVDAADMKTFVVEQSWKPSLEVSATGGGMFRTFISINWVCDPFCGDEYRFNGRDGTISNSPLIRHVDMENHADLMYNSTTRFTTFTYAADNPGVLIDQKYEQFVHTFHVLPAPEDWSFVNGDELPF